MAGNRNIERTFAQSIGTITTRSNNPFSWSGSANVFFGDGYYFIKIRLKITCWLHGLLYSLYFYNLTGKRIIDMEAIHCRSTVHRPAPGCFAPPEARP